MRDGTPGWVWPLQHGDREQLAEEFTSLSPESRRRRFLAPVVQLSESMLTSLVDQVDGVDHVALVLFAEDGDHYDPVAIGRIVRYPTVPDAADIAVTVKDTWQGRGVASALLPVLVAERPKGVTHLVTEVIADNPASLAMLRRLGPTLEADGGYGEIEVRVQLDDTPRGENHRWLIGAHRSERKNLRTRDLICPWLIG